MIAGARVCVRTVAAAPLDLHISTGAWNESGDLLLGARGGLFHAPPSGGDPKAVAPADAARGEAILDVPQFLPDGRHYLFSAFSMKPDQSGVYVGVLGSAERRLLLPSIPWAAFAPQGYLVFRRESVLFAQRYAVGAATTVRSSRGTDQAHAETAACKSFQHND